MSTSDFISVACYLGVKAAAKLTELSLQPLQKERKADHSIVTNADFAADKIIRDGLQAAFPDHAILTEESGLHGDQNAEFMWVVDPLDGTRAYAKAVAGYSVMIGLLRHGKPYAGVVADPWEKHLYYAEKGVGAFLEPLARGLSTPLHVSSRRDYAQMPIVTSTGFSEPMAKRIQTLVSSPWLPSINSVGIKVGLVVRQVADIYLNHHHVHYWDTCAPQAILEEAGGRISFFDGRPLTYELDNEYRHAGPTLVSNGFRHDELLEALHPILVDVP